MSIQLNWLYASCAVNMTDTVPAQYRFKCDVYNAGLFINR